jgi:Tat protein translocase TatB subunit
MGAPPTIEFASLGMWDSFILMVMALVVFGPRRLPEIGRQIGKLMYEFRKASNDFKFQMEEELRTAEDADRRKKEEDRVRALVTAAPLTIDAASSNSVPEVAATNTSGYPLSTTATSEVHVETWPTIMPPSTGEQVAAARPNSVTTLGAGEQGFLVSDNANLNSEAAPSAVSKNVPVDHSTPDAEQAAHHG